MRGSATALALLICLIAMPVRAFDEFSNGYSPTNFVLGDDALTLTFKGELELEFHDIEGEGGPGHDSPTDTKTLGTRSPFVELDSFWLAVRLGMGQHVGLYSILDFRPNDARLGAVFADFRMRSPHWLSHHLEAGYHPPFVKVDRRTERYPLIATAYWREPELHLLYEARAELGHRTSCTAGATLAMMRPLAPAGVQESTSESGTINILGLDGARTFSGNGPVVGARLGAETYGVSLEAFAFLGRMAAEDGTDVLRSALPNYRYLDGGGTSDRTGDFGWAGARLGYHDHNVHLWVEAIVAKEDLLTRYGGYAQLSYAIPLPAPGGWFPALEPLVRIETFRLLDSTDLLSNGQALRSSAPINAVSWDYDVLTLALLTQAYKDLVRLRLEVYFITEHNGVPALGIADTAFANNELLLQLELRF